MVSAREGVDLIQDDMPQLLMPTGYAIASTTLPVFINAKISNGNMVYVAERDDEMQQRSTNGTVS
jgi:hypothetical protein